MPTPRFFVPSVTAFVEAFGSALMPMGQPAGEHHEALFFDDDVVSLGPDRNLRVRRMIDPLMPGAIGEARYDVEGPRRPHAPQIERQVALSLESASDHVRRATGLSGLVPYCVVRFRRLQFEIEGLGTVMLDTDVNHYAVEDGALTLVGTEGHPRVSLCSEGPLTAAARKLLDALPNLPHISKGWMAYCSIGRRTKALMKRVNELPGFEYEVKLHAEHLDIDPRDLPFPVHRAFQTHSVRRYYDGYRVSFRLARATWVTKGKVERVDGVPRRGEQKQKELSAWQLPPTKLEIRRIKRTLVLLNERNGRTYNLCLDRCRRDGGKGAQEMLQIEIEYVGTTSRTPAEASREVEREVTTDMARIRDFLMQRYGFATTEMSKRDFARGKLKKAV